MDQGGKKNRLRRHDFDSEEAWESYNSKLEATPKAAVSFQLEFNMKNQCDNLIILLEF